MYFFCHCHFSLGARRDIMASNKNEQCVDRILTRKVLSKVQKSCRQECALFVWIRVDWWHLPELQYLAIQWSGNNTRDTTCSSLKMNGPRLVLVPSSEGSAYNKSIQSIFQQCDIDIHFMYKLEIYCSPWQLSLFQLADIRMQCGGASPAMLRIADILRPSWICFVICI